MHRLIKFPFVIQHDERDCGAACFSMIAEFYGSKLKLESCRNLIKVGPEGASMYGIIIGADKIGFDAEPYESDVSDLLNEVKAGNVKLPIIVRILTDQMYEHFTVLYAINNKNVILGDPAKTKIRKMPLKEFENIWLGQLITFEKREDFISRNEREHNIRKYFIEIKKQKVAMFLVLLGAVILLFINLAGAYLFRFILSDSYNVFYIWGHVITDGIDKICLALILLYLFRILVEILRCNILTVVTKNIDISITMGYFKHLVKMKMEAFDTRLTGDFISRFYDTADIREAVSSVVLSAVIDAVMAFICGAILVKLNIQMFLITVLTVVLYSIIIFSYKHKIKKVKNDIMSAEARVTSSLKESIDGMQTIKAHNLENHCYHKVFNLYERFANRILIGTRVINIQNALATFIASAGVVVVISIGYKEYLKGILSIADIFTFYYMLDYFMGPISGLIKLQPDIETAVIAADRLADVMDIELEKQPKDNSDTIVLDGDIIFNNVTFGYGYDNPIFSHMNIVIKKGAKTAIVGGSGSGKTTIAKLIMGFYYPEEGDIFIGNTNMKDCSVNSIRNSIAYISQETFLFESSLYSNLVLGNSKIDKDEVNAVIEKCGLSDFVKRLPLGLNTLIAEGGKNLSGGERQRIAIARALLSQKKIMIMDEVTSSLDDDLGRKINHMIANLPSDITCIIITHREDVTDFCDEIYSLG